MSECAIVCVCVWLVSGWMNMRLCGCGALDDIKTWSIIEYTQCTHYTFRPSHNVTHSQEGTSCFSSIKLEPVCVLAPELEP